MMSKVGHTNGGGHKQGIQADVAGITLLREIKIGFHPRGLERRAYNIGLVRQHN